MIDNDDYNILAGDIPCRRCDYNLRGLNRQGRCPECNLKISNSLIGQHLSHSHPAWVTRIYRGCWWSGVGWVATGIIAALAAIRSVISVPAYLNPLLNHQGQTLFLITSTMVYAGGLYFSLAPLNVFDDRITRCRRIFLALSTALYACVLTITLSAMFKWMWIPWYFKGQMFLMVFLLLPCLEFLRAQWLSVLSRQIPDERLYQTTRLFARILAGLFGVLALFLIIGHALPRWLDWFGFRFGDFPFEVFKQIAFFAWCATVFVASLLGLFTIHLSREFRIQSARAAANWLRDQNDFEHTKFNRSQT